MINAPFIVPGGSLFSKILFLEYTIFVNLKAKCNLLHRKTHCKKSLKLSAINLDV